MVGFAQPKYAVRKIVRNSDGTTGIIYVDPKTGQQINNPEGYNIVEARNNTNPPGGTVQSQEKPPEKGFSEKFIDNTVRPENGGAQTDSNRGTMADQYGYTNKPGWAGLVGLVPGPIGLLGKLGNIGINAANTAAVNNQKEVLGFAQPTGLQNIGSALSDKHGYIGDATYGIGDNQRTTPVSFEGVDPVGRTTLTPNEARMRNELDPSFQQATVAQVANARDAYESKYGTTGFLGGLANAAKGFFGNLFGTPAVAGNTGSAGESGGSAGTSAGSSGSSSTPSIDSPNSSGPPGDDSASSTNSSGGTY